MSPNDADEMANSVDPDQTAPLGAVWSGSALFAQAWLSENLGSLRYDMFSLLQLVCNVKVTRTRKKGVFCLFVLWFNVRVNNYGHVQMVS